MVAMCSRRRGWNVLEHNNCPDLHSPREHPSHTAHHGSPHRWHCSDTQALVTPRLLKLWWALGSPHHTTPHQNQGSQQNFALKYCFFPLSNGVLIVSTTSQKLFCLTFRILDFVWRILKPSRLICWVVGLDPSLHIYIVLYLRKAKSI